MVNVLDEKYDLSAEYQAKLKAIEEEKKEKQKLKLFSSEVEFCSEKELVSDHNSPINNLKFSAIRCKPASQYKEENLTLSQCIKVDIDPAET
jgi:hypothetical protein